VESATFPNTFCSSGGVRNIATRRSSEQFIICLACVRIGKGRLIEGSSGGVECLFYNITRSSTHSRNNTTKKMDFSGLAFATGTSIKLMYRRESPSSLWQGRKVNTFNGKVKVKLHSKNR
jgi:hypothetical protein